MEKDLKGLRIDPEKRGENPSSSRWKISFLGLAASVVALAGGYYFWFDRVREDNGVAAAAAANEPAKKDGSVSSVTPVTPAVLIVSGYVVAHHKIEVGSKVMGKVAWVGVEKGDRVKQEQLLVKLDDREYRAQVKEAEATLEAARARLSELQTGNRPQEIQRAGAELDRFRAELRNALLEFDRLRSLLEAGVVSRHEVDNAQSRLEGADAAVRAAEKNFELLSEGPRREQIEQAGAEVNRAQAALEYARTLRDATEIRAPISGTVLERIAEVGEMVTTSFAGEMGAKSAVVSLADLNDLQVELDISQSDFNRISRDLECRMSPEAYPDREYLCEIAEISPEANRQKATIQVKVQILAPDEFLRTEMTARVTFSRKETKP